VPATNGKPAANLLGAGRAEADPMLTKAFVETPSYRALVETQDFNFVVGRRGTGKSALFEHVHTHYAEAKNTILIAEKPPEHSVIEFQRLIGRMGDDYRTLRAITRLVWKAHLLLEIVIRNAADYRFSKSIHHKFLADYIARRRNLTRQDGVSRCVALLSTSIAEASHAVEVPGRLAADVEIDKLQTTVKGLLAELNWRVALMYDGLDEGWTPDPIATAVIGGLARAAGDFIDIQAGIYPMIFVRDNIFRALAQLDPDFTRHIEGHILRLHWDESSLFHFVARRLRVAFGIEDQENDVRVWNRFAHKGLKDLEGFSLCLRNTLYRPRDTIVLLNEAYVNAAQAARTEIVDEDVEASATRISNNRLDDLLKEYDVVFPGLRLFVSLFHARSTQDRYGAVVGMLDEAIATSDYANPAARDFSLFNSGKEIATALYSVGFLGIREATGSSFVFCHDGAASPLLSIDSDRPVTIHPCYWKALELGGDIPPEEVMVQINDEYEAPPAKQTADFRVKLYGEIAGTLPRIQLGREQSQDFEQWALRSVRVLFAGKLMNVQLKPNAGGIQQRDVVATNLAQEGFWRRILEDYRSRQVVFEVKNYEELTPEDFRQILSYLTGLYGNFAVVVTRALTEVPTEREREWLRVMWHEHQRVILILPALLVARCVSKLRNPDRKYDYTEETLNKRMDLFARSYLDLRQAVRFRKKRHR